jgi:hypothetical protein
MIEQRSQPRLTDAEIVMIFWDERGERAFQLANVRDISSDGAGLVVDHPLPVGTPVIMSYGKDGLNAIVRHCSLLLDRHAIGIEFVEADKQSPIHFDPDLLVRPA